MRLAPGTGDVKVYDVSGRAGASLAASLSIGAAANAMERRARRRAEGRPRDAELVHDLEFPSISSHLQETPDGCFLVAAGAYPPQVHVYDLAQLSLKFQRNLPAHIVALQPLVEDWRKLALLRADRTIDLHAQFGTYYQLRVPTFGRDLALHRGSCELYVAGVGPEVWRLNLERGHFMRPLRTRVGSAGENAEEDAGNNCVEVSAVNHLVAVGGTTGVVEVWDPRDLASGQPAGVLDVGAALQAAGEVEVTALDFGREAVRIAVGISTGQALLFDLRSDRPQVVKEQGYGLPVNTVKLHGDGKHVLSADKKCIKVWDRTSGKNFVVIEPDVDVNSLCVIGNSGVLCAAVEAPRVRSYYVPALGPAPRWCSFLDTVTEELEENSLSKAGTLQRVAESVMYENYKFVTQNELEDLGLEHLIGTDLLKPYMHGFFINLRLYRRAVDASQPFAYQKYRKEQAQKKISAERESRIGKVRRRATASAKVPKVNVKLAQSLLEKARKKNPQAASALEDERFKIMFEDKQFEVDEESERFKHLNPSTLAMAKRGRRAGEASDSDSDEEYLEGFELVKENGEAAEGRNSDSSDEEEAWGTSDDDDDDNGDNAEDSSEGEDKIAKPAKGKGAAARPGDQRVPNHGPRMYEIGNRAEMLGGIVNTGSKGKTGVDRRVAEQVPLGQRIEREESNVRRSQNRRASRRNRKGARSRPR